MAKGQWWSGAERSTLWFALRCNQWISRSKVHSCSTGSEKVSGGGRISDHDFPKDQTDLSMTLRSASHFQSSSQNGHCIVRVSSDQSDPRQSTAGTVVPHGIDSLLFGLTATVTHSITTWLRVGRNPLQKNARPNSMGQTTVLCFHLAFWR